MARYFSANRTLCTASSNYLSSFVSEGETVVVSVSTSAAANVSFSVVLYVQEDFNLQINVPYKGLELSPSAPLFLRCFWYSISNIY